MADELVEAEIRIQRTATGRRLTHPTGVVVDETTAEIAAERATLIARVAEAEASLTEHDLVVARVAALTVTTSSESDRG